MNRLIDHLSLAGYGAGGMGMFLLGPSLWNVGYATAAAAAFATTTLFVATHLLTRLAVREQSLAGRVAQQDRLLAQLSARVEAQAVPAPAQPPAADGGVLALVRDAVAKSRVDLYLQGIVQLPGRGVVHYEAFSRVRDEDGRVVLPAEFFPAIEAAGLAASLDNLQLARCVTLARRLGAKRPETRIFCNIAAPALSDAAFIGELLSFMQANATLAARLIFEISARDLARLDDATLAGLAGLGQLGFGFSLDGYRLGDARVEHAVAALGTVRYAKIDADALIASGVDIVGRLRRADVDVVATRVESERQVVELLDRGVGFGQGYLFGYPRPARLEGGEQAARAA